MSPDTINEIVWHFAGYFRLTDNVARDRLEYLDGTLRQHPDDYSLPLPTTPFRADLDPFDTHSHPPPVLDISAANHVSGYRDFRAHQSEVSSDLDDLPTTEPRIVIPGAGGGSVGGGGSIPGPHREITVRYDNDGNQQQVEIHQVNHMVDHDVLLVTPHTGATELNDANPVATFRDMSEAAANATPAEVALPVSGVMEVAGFVLARDSETSAAEDATGEHSVGPGIYLNGELQGAGYVVTLPDLSPADATDAPADIRGQLAVLGSNTAVNAALLVDFNESSPTMIVLGDYFATEAIVQTYSFTDHDQVSVGGSELNETATGNNSANNVAHFDHQPSVYPDLAGYFSGWSWNVHVVEGDFYDINLLVQDIFLSDRDVTVQETQQSLQEVHTGENLQINVMELFGGDFDYDLIIIGGDYHSGNYIFQHLFLVDDDVVMMSSTDGDPTQTIGTGDNLLLNYATIQTYGGLFIPLTDDAQSLVSALENRETSLDPQEHGFVAPAIGEGPLSVLYVTGDYYDVNAIWQYITVADPDTALQLLGSDDALAGAEGSALIQSIQTGANTLLNDAAIADVGSGTTQVGGDVYTDTILVQAEFVAENDDTTAHNGTDVLVSELIAFIGTEEEADTDWTAPAVLPHHEDPIGGVLA